MAEEVIGISFTSVTRPVTISGKLTDDAKHHQIRAVRLAIKLKNERLRQVCKDRRMV
jgi:hypothetical protein